MQRVGVICSHVDAAADRRRGAAAPAAARPLPLRDVAKAAGMRITVAPGLTDGIWGAWPAIKQILYVKKIPVTLVSHPAGPETGGKPGGQDELYALTAQRSLPVLFWEQERPRSSWIEQVTLAERVGTGPKLIPDDAAQRVQMFGMLNEILGEDGFCFNNRIKGSIKNKAFVAKYGGIIDVKRATARLVEVLRMLDAMMHAQEQRRSSFLIGDALTALDVYWACCTVFISDPGREFIRGPMPQMMIKNMAKSNTPEITAAFTPRLQKHRVFILRTYCELPPAA